MKIIQQKKIMELIIPVEISGVNNTSSCIFPDIFYNDVITINCTISDLSQIEEFNGEITHGDSKDRIQILYSTIRVDNLIKANELFSESIITFPNDTNSNNGNNEFKHIGKYKKSGGLSGGAIVGIVVPLALALIALTVLSIMCSNKATPPYTENPSSVYELKNNK